VSFHRWLPDGRKDAVRFPTADTRNSLELWLERTGYVEGAFIKHDPERTEVSEDIMIRNVSKRVPSAGRAAASTDVG